MEYSSPYSNLSNKTIVNKIMKNIKDILHVNPNNLNASSQNCLNIQTSNNLEKANFNKEISHLDHKSSASEENSKTSSIGNNIEYKSINDLGCINYYQKERKSAESNNPHVSVQKEPELLIDTSIDPTQTHVILDDKTEMLIDSHEMNKNNSNIMINLTYREENIDKELERENKEQEEITSISNDAQSIINQLLGKKTCRDPMEYAKTLTKKHDLGNIKCEDIILDNDKYDKDIEMVMKYANSQHPFKLIIEFCQKFKWPLPEIDTFEIGTNENPEFKTTISIKNNKFRGEALGAQKKTAKKNAAIKALTNLLEDPVVRDSMKMFVKGILLKQEDDLRSHVKIKENLNEEDDGEYLRIKEEQMLEITEKEEKERVEKLLKEYYQNNPLVKLNFFKNKVKIPFSFTYSQKPKFKIATLYVGSEIYGVGEDRNVKIAKYKASAEGLSKIIEKYGEEVLKTKEERRQKVVSEIKEDIVSDEEKGIVSHLSLRKNIKQIEDLIQDLNKNTMDTLCLQKKFELFLLKYERNILPINDFNEMEKTLAKLFYVNKTISINFNDPLLVGSFSGDCVSIKNKVIDLIFVHKLNREDFKICLDSLINNFNSIFNETQSQPDIKMKNKNEIEMNVDIEIAFKEKDYSFMLLIRNQETDREFIEYIPMHNDIIIKSVENSTNFNSLRRLLRSWRRKFNLLFVKPELLDWVAYFYVKNTLSESVFHKLSKDFKNLFLNSEIVPPVIRNEVDKFNQEKYDKLYNSCMTSKDYIADSKFEMLFR